MQLRHVQPVEQIPLNAIRVVIADDQTLIREGLALLALVPDLQVVGQAADPDHLAAAIRAAQEALTNVERHAATTPRVTLTLCYEPETVRLRAQNAPPLSAPVARASAGGYGLRRLGGFCVEMTLPQG